MTTLADQLIEKFTNFIGFIEENFPENPSVQKLKEVLKMGDKNLVCLFIVNYLKATVLPFFDKEVKRTFWVKCDETTEKAVQVGDGWGYRDTDAFKQMVKELKGEEKEYPEAVQDKFFRYLDLFCRLVTE